MSRTLYNSACMIKPGQTFSPKEMEALVKKALYGPVTIQRRDKTVTVSLDDGSLSIAYNDAAYVPEECQEFAADYNIDCADCATRYDTWGRDPDLLLCTDLDTLHKAMLKTGKFVILDLDDLKEVT